MIKGACHCKRISFELSEDELSVRYCYCETCRKLSGANYSLVARVDRDNFSITKGHESLTIYESLPGKKRHYCSNCFSPLHVITDNEPSFLRVRAGLLDGTPVVNVIGHIWVSEKPSWCKIEDDLPTYLYEYVDNA